MPGSPRMDDLFGTCALSISRLVVWCQGHLRFASLLGVDAVSAAEVNVNVTDSGAFDRFLAAVQRIEQLRR
jgi:hypothetical protein